MRGNTCCIARGPPSPDGRPPRRINPVAVRPHASDEARMVSWSSRFSKPEDAAELYAIFQDGDASTLKRRRAGRSKLQKRFSRDSTLTNRRSGTSTVGISEEEGARREELKRIRAKKLQEELGDICVYDEDATPLCSSPFGQASKSATNDSDEASQDDSVNAIIDAYSSHRVDPGDYQPLPSGKMAVDTAHRSDPAIEEPEIPLPPVLNPKNMPNIDDTSIGRTSWRLSFTSPHRSSCLRALSLSNPKDQSISGANLTVPTSDSQLSPGKKKKWLSSQGRRPLEAQHPSTASDELTSGIIGPQVPEKAPAIPLHEMQISQRLASAGTFIPPQQTYEYKDRPLDGELASLEESFREINTRRSRYFRNISGSGFSESKVPRAWGQVLGDGTSSLHKSDVEDNLGQTHKSSPGPDLSLTIMQGQNIVPSYLQVPRIVITKPDEPYGINPVNRRHQEHSGEGYSSRESESCIRTPLPSTPPNTDVNEYLRIPEYSEARNSPETDRRRLSTPLTSKFSEDFDEPDSKSSFRSSLLSAMRLSGLGRLTRSFDGEDTVDSVATERQSGQHKAKPAKNGTPLRTTSRKESVSLDGSKSSSMESAEIMWTKAFRQSIHGISRGAESREIHPSPASKRSKLDGRANNANKQRNERTSTDETDNSRRSSQSTRSSFVIPPESWANFPSHSRESRCGGTGPYDGVARSDFAFRELLNGLHEDAAGTKKPQHKDQGDSPRHYLSGRLTMKVRTSFDRLLSPRRGTSQHEAIVESTKPIYQGMPDAPKVPRRGSMDDLLERRGAGDDLLSPEARAKNNRAKRRDKYKTWSGRDNSHVADIMALRQSTVDFMAQAQVMEEVERERALRAADEVLERMEGETYIAAVVDAIAGNGVRTKRVEQAIVVLIAVEVVMMGAVPGISVQRAALGRSVNVRGEGRAAAEAAADGVALPVHVAGEGVVAGVVGLLAVLGVGAVGVVLAYVYLGVNGGAEDVAVGEINGLAGALLERGFAFDEIEGHWRCCDGDDKGKESEEGELHFVQDLVC
ncbi:hypothetical protein V502_09040 [Pseudogymnoascus sp. VKM F-4520 (FW-2644)]|nr:hypothetical protein V502_09040 [Pseudogymnoascus sp. VKM F-4520 (FW-2644)]